MQGNAQGIHLLGLFQGRVVKYILLNLLVAIAYAVGVRLSHEFATLPGTVASVWFPSGMTLALVYWYGHRVVLGIVCGSTFALYFGLAKIMPSLSMFGLVFILVACACGNVAQPLLATYLIKKYAKHRQIFSHVKTVILYIVAAIFSPMVSATLGISSLCITNTIPWQNFGISWLTWWLGSALPHLIFSPTLIIWRDFWKIRHHYNLWEIGIGGLLFLVISWLAFARDYPLAYFLLPVLIWTVFRYGSFVSNLLVTVVSLIAILSTAWGHGLYVKGSPNDSLLLLQSFMAVFGLTSLILSATIDERTEAQMRLQQALENMESQVIERTEALQQSEAQINGFFSSAPIGMGIVDCEFKYVRVNQVLADINGHAIADHHGKSSYEILNSFSSQIEDIYRQVLTTGKSLSNLEISSDTLSQKGEVQTWLCSYFPIFNTDQIPFRVGFVVTDISDRKKVEAELRYTESVLRKANLELEKLVNVDGLTQVANRRCFDNRLEDEWSRLCRDVQPLSLLLFDIDYFKLYNDCYGHQAGDDCLKLVAQAAQAVLYRPADLVARYGGEEFAVILPNTDRNGALVVAEQIRSEITRLDIVHQNSHIGDTVTISIGVASVLPDQHHKANLLIKWADLALYQAKQQGRDRIEFFDPSMYAS